MLVDECAFGEVDETIWVVGWIAIVHEGQVRHVQSSAGKENNLLGHLPAQYARIYYANRWIYKNILR